MNMNSIVKGISIVAVSFALIACGNKNTSAVQPDVETLAQTLVSELDFSGSLMEMDASSTEMYFSLPSTTEAAFYMGMRSTSEAVGVFKCQDEAEANDVLASVNEYLAEQKEAYSRYMPEAAAMLDEAAVVKNNNYVVFVVSGDKTAAVDKINSEF